MIDRIVTDRLRRRFAVLISVAAVCAGAAAARAQDGADEPPPRHTTSARPVLVDIEFEGNEEPDLTDKVLKAQITSKGTERPALRVFSIFARVYDINPLMPQRHRDMMHEIVDSLSGEERYFNPRLLQEDTMALRRIYQQFGYNEVQLDYRILIDTARNRSRIRFFIDEGPRYRNHGITYVGLEEVPDEVRDKFSTPEAFDVGEDYRGSEVVDESARAVAILQNEGYPFAARTGVVTIHRDDSLRGERYNSTLVSIYTGERYRFGQTSYRPDDESEGPELKTWVVMRQLEYEPGQWYSRQQVDQSLSNLYGLGVFEYVRLDSLSETTSGDTLGMQLVTKLNDPRTLLITPEASFERYVNDYYAFIGLGATFTHANLFGGAEKLSVQLRGRLPFADVTDEPLFTYGGTVSYTDQTLLGRRQSIGLNAGYDRSMEDRVIEARVVDGESDEKTYPLMSDRLFGSAEWTMRFPKHTFFGSFTARTTLQYLRYMRVRDYIFKKATVRVSQWDTYDTLGESREALAIEAVNEALLRNIFREQVWLGDDSTLPRNAAVRENFDRLKMSVVLNGSATGDKRDDFFAPRNGYYVDFRSEIGVTFAGTSWFKGEAEYRHYLPWDDDKAVALRGHLGGIVPVGVIKHVPLTSRFWAGGANSLRGWGPREMLVTTPPELPGDTVIGREVVQQVLADGRRLLGGLILTELSADWRWRPFNFPATSTLMQQVNQLMMIVGLDVGGAFFRDFDEDEASLERFVDNIGVAPSLAIGYDTPIGPIRVGFGWALHDPINHADEPWVTQRPVTIGDWAWFFSIGHAF
ncbi:MAG TPA: BamA/TamA family outer membrane protein [Candidatus Kapabacteria bacterium]|nr:BamA/TamA family outer membrane protein [Candidatus Kapabacteria bacterium]